MKTKKQQIKQKIAAVVVVFFMAVMVFGSRDEFALAIGTNTTLIQNFIAGSLQLETAASLGFNDITVGVAANSLATLGIVNIRDYRGSGAGWTITGTANSMFTAVAGPGNSILNTTIAWAPGSIWALDGGASNTGVAVGGASYFGGGLLTLANAASNNGVGNYKLTNTALNIVYGGSAAQKIGSYQGTLTMTIQ